MPDWVTTLISALIGGLFGAGGLAAYTRAKNDARLTAEAQQDDHTLKLLNALNADEAEFRKAVYEAYLAEVARNKTIDERLTTTINQLAAVTLERDLFKRQLDQANERIKHLESEVARLSTQQETHL